MTLTEFLTARLDEDEAWARGQQEVRRAQALAARSAFGVSHLIVGDRLDPARTLAEVAAKRAAIEAAWADHIRIEGEWGVGRSQAGLEALNDFPDVVRHLASIYADHPDYQADWA